MTETAIIDGVQQMGIKALWFSMPQSEYDALPDRQGMDGLPVDGVTYRDSAHCGLIYRCRAGSNWAAYSYTVFAPKLI